jgi:uncharacterized protein (UPF0276 family)
MAADHIQLDVDTYINHLPVNRLREIYTTGVMHDDRIGRLRDHFAMSELDWALVSWAMRRIREGDWPRPDVVTLEYGGVGPKFEWRSRGDVLAFDIPRLRDQMRLVDSAGVPEPARAV